MSLEESIQEYLELNGPSSSRHICKGTGGSISEVIKILNKSDKFTQDPSARWHLTSKVKE